jgi:hypothetical protein
MSDDVTPEEFLRALHDPGYALELVEAQKRRGWTRMQVASGLACPAPDCGLTYRHQHGEVWWPPEGNAE